MANYKTLDGLDLDIGGFTDSVTSRSQLTRESVAERNRGIFSRPELEDNTSGGFLDGMINWFAENGHSISKDIDSTTIKDNTLKEYQNLKIRDDGFDVMSFKPQGEVLKDETPELTIEDKYIPIDTSPAVEVQPTSGKVLEDKVVNRIIELEGFIGEAKKAFSNEKYFTYGYGTYGPNVKEGQKITEQEAEKLLREKELPKRVKIARNLFNDFNNFTDDLKVEILQAVYRGDFEADQDVVSLINKGMWEEASKEFLNHAEYKKAKSLGSKSDRYGIVPRLEAVSKALYQEQFK